MKWFREVKDIQELRIQYKKLLLEHHPDNGGEVSDMHPRKRHGHGTMGIINAITRERYPWMR